MKFWVTDACTIQGKRYAAGDVVDVDFSIAKSLLGRYLSSDMPKADNRSVGLEASSEAPVKRSKKQSD